MKKKLLAIFLLVSSLIFSEERILLFEEIFLDEKTEMVYAIGEETPYTGVVEDYKFLIKDRVLEGRVIFKNGLMEGTFKLLYPSGKIARIMTYKNGLIDGLMKNYYPNGNIRSEMLLKKEVLDGITRTYYKNGKLKKT